MDIRRAIRAGLVLWFVGTWPAFAQDVPRPDWKPRFRGVDVAELSATQPRRMKGWAVRIDLQADGIGIVTTPPKPGSPERTSGQKTSSFLTSQKCQVAVNGAAFSPVVNEEGKELTPAGLHVAKGRVVSKGNGKYDALLFGKANRAWVASPPFDTKDVENGVGGFQIVLKGGRVPDEMPDYNKGPVHPRTAAGISADGKQLYLVVFDGRQAAWSEGASIREVGQWLKTLGSADGINLDGGGTTTLVIEGPDGKPNVLNRPIHGNVPGTERVSGSHLGVFAKPFDR